MIQRHPTGYIQLNLNATTRLNIWSERLLGRAIEVIHAHTFSYRSTVLAGALLHEEWQTMPGEDYAIVRAETIDGVDILTATGRGTAIGLTRQSRYDRGHVYAFPAGAYHCIRPMGDPVITLLEKTRLDVVGGPFLLLPSSSAWPRGVPHPLASFDRHAMPEDELWTIVKEAVSTAVDLAAALAPR